jgi:hypothetical protein
MSNEILSCYVVVVITLYVKKGVIAHFIANSRKNKGLDNE